MNEPANEYGWTPSGITPTPSGITRSPILRTCAEYGCRVNEIDVDDLFERYRELNFLYPAKLEALAPYWDEVKSNWRKALSAGDKIIRVVTASAEESGREGWASLTYWRTTDRCWTLQHLVSAGHPMYSRAVMLGTGGDLVHSPDSPAFENWFRPDNRFPARVFGTLRKTMGERQVSLHTFDIVRVPITGTRPPKSSTTIQELVSVNEECRQLLVELALQCRGFVYVEAEGLDQEDLLLERLDADYGKVGLRRYRRIWIVNDPKTGQAIAAAIAYRGPLGLNFSFLESRCDLLLNPAAEPSEIRNLIPDLIAHAAQAYADFSPGFMPIVSPHEVTPLLEETGGTLFRTYSHSACLHGAFPGYYRHVESIYVRLLKAFDRRGKLDRGLVPQPDQQTPQSNNKG